MMERVVAAPEDFSPAIQTGRSDRVDFALNTAEPRFAQTICAFANTGGGIIFIGVQQIPENASPSDSIKVEVHGTDARQAHGFLADIRNYFDDPLPQMQLEEVSHAGPGGPAMAAHLAGRSGNVDVALADLTVWDRKGPQNESHLARAHRLRPSPHEARGEGGDTLSGSVDVDFQSARADGGRGASTGEERETGVLNDDTPPVEKPDVEIHASDSTEASDRGGEPDPTRQAAGRLDRDARFRREADESERSLNADAYADVIARLLSNADNDERMTFALLGYWGRGKTYLANRIRGKLTRISQRYSTVMFGAWKCRTTSPECSDTSSNPCPMPISSRCTTTTSWES